MSKHHFFNKAIRANANAIRCLKRARNWHRAKYWNRQCFHYFELHIMRETKFETLQAQFRS